MRACYESSRVVQVESATVTLRCIRNEKEEAVLARHKMPEKMCFSIAHVCDRCKAIGPTAGYFDYEIPPSQWPAFAQCDRQVNCQARQAGWTLSEKEDLCPNCRPPGKPSKRPREMNP